MTGFGAGEVSYEGTSYKVEARSVNHRYCEVSLKLPRDLTFLESRFRSLVLDRFSRGRFDITVTRNGSPGEEIRPSLNLPVARSYYKMLKTIEDEFHIKDTIRSVDLLQLRDVMTFEEASLPSDVEKVIRPVFVEALNHLEAMRRQEGGALSADLLDKLLRMESFLTKIEKRIPGVMREYDRRLRQSVSEFVKPPTQRAKRALRGRLHPAMPVEGATRAPLIDEGRIVTELALMADRRDVSEEIVRLRSHIDQFRKIIREGKAVGRRLDFLVQELHREINTIVSKAGDAKVSQFGVEMKSELEKLREQVQNIE
ncbi:MAG: YicC family protein [Nitrospirae bacterium]|nr:YicC family protein [Nitrospirota bacterium]